MMRFDYPNRKKNRLERYDYSQNGAYFITICTKNKQCILSRIVGGGVLDAPATHLLAPGAAAEDRIRQMNLTYPDVQTVKYAIMPNHIHLLIHISREENAAAAGPSGTPAPTNGRIPQYVSTFKRLCNRQMGADLWQRSYHDRIIRNDAEYDMIWQYIDTNPHRWEQDCFYTEE